MRSFLFLTFSILIISCFLSFKNVIAKEKINCENRFVTLVNPVRGRNLWFDEDIKYLKDQYDLVKQYQLSATWLLQYDVFGDEQLLYEIKKFDDNQEKGIFLEVSEKLATDARVIYPHATPWFSPKAVFLSGYSQSERRKLIDKLFKEFKLKFNFYPKSVGAWWIDSYSLNYMRKKYGIKAAMIVADQKTTDNYGIWGQWWGVPYYPSKANILVPADNINNQQDIIIAQWAQRDLSHAYNFGPQYSNHSLQANDYISLGFNTEYFKRLSAVYLDCNLAIGQITVGLETGMESVEFIDEYKNQLDYLKSQENLQAVKLSEFYDKYKTINPQNPKRIILGDENSVWELTTKYRRNEKLKDYIKYNQGISFRDFFVADKGEFLNRRLQENIVFEEKWYFPIWILVGIIATAVALKKKFINFWFPIMLFSFGAYGLILHSYNKFGWIVNYGPHINNLNSVQVLIMVLSFSFSWILFKYKAKLKMNNTFLILLPLTFSIDFLTQRLRISLIENWYYFGFMLDQLHFIGVKFNKLWQVELINQDFPAYLAAALLKLDYQKITESGLSYFILLPVAHIWLAIILFILLPLFPKRLRYGILFLMFASSAFYFLELFVADPRIAI